MLGSVSEAENEVQEALLRVHQAQIAEPEDRPSGENGLDGANDEDLEQLGVCGRAVQAGECRGRTAPTGA
jgi:hypothetical protein